MTVAQWTQTNFTTQDPTTYKGAIDGNFAVAAPIVAGFAPHAGSPPAMTVTVEAGQFWNGAAIVAQPLQTSAVIAAPVANPRIDRVVIDQATGAIAVVTGTEAASPAPPAIPAGKVPCAQIALAVGQSAIGNSGITDERSLGMLGLGTAAQRNVGTGGGNVPLLNGSNTWSGTQAMSGAAINEAETTIASAATLNIGAAAANYLSVTGSNNITAFDTAQAGAERTLVFAGALTITNSANIILPGGANYTTAAGDSLTFRSEGGGVWRCVSYALANGQAIAVPTPGFSNRVFLTSGSGNWTVPTGVTRFRVRLWGAGGSGGSGYASDGAGASGGSGAYCERLITGVIPGTVMSYTVGQGGAGIPANVNSAGNAGGYTTFNSWLTAGGGGGGANGQTGAGQSGGAGGVCSGTFDFGINGYSGWLSNSAAVSFGPGAPFGSGGTLGAYASAAGSFPGTFPGGASPGTISNTQAGSAGGNGLIIIDF
ncbi:MAG TPA: hypothetical protein VKY65_17895 [Alphaproteobacteria bacterium]|nr:hypothetical protein [Alphaproteobacteria bacterium]